MRFDFWQICPYFPCFIRIGAVDLCPASQRLCFLSGEDIERKRDKRRQWNGIDETIASSSSSSSTDLAQHKVKVWLCQLRLDAFWLDAK